MGKKNLQATNEICYNTNWFSLGTNVRLWFRELFQLGLLEPESHTCLPLYVEFVMNSALSCIIIQSPFVDKIIIGSCFILSLVVMRTRVFFFL
jgi:hypothetical protein